MPRRAACRDVQQIGLNFIRNDGVGGSNPSCGTNQIKHLGKSARSSGEPAGARSGRGLRSATRALETNLAARLRARRVLARNVLYRTVLRNRKAIVRVSEVILDRGSPMAQQDRWWLAISIVWVFVSAGVLLYLGFA